MKRLRENIMGYTQEDLLLIRQEAKDRVDNKGGWPRDWNEKKTDEQIVEEGILGEWAYAAYYQISRDQRLLPRNRGDNGVDLVLNGQTIDVKASTVISTLNPARLPMPLHKSPNPSDYLALAIIDKRSYTVRLAGIITTERFHKICYVGDMGFGPRRCVDQKDLDPALSILATETDSFIDTTPPLTVSSITLQWIADSIPVWRKKYWNETCHDGKHQEYALDMLKTVLLDYRTIIQGEPPKEVVSV